MDSLVLWDIDRTLVTVDGLGREIFATAFREVTGRDLERAPDFAGRTDYELAATALVWHGIEVDRELLEVFFAAMSRGTSERAADILMRGRALAGSHAAIEAFAGLKASIQTVATGNVPVAAHTKLAAFGLDTHLDLEIGGYGTDAAERPKVVGLARQRAERRYGVRVPDGRVMVVGDTPNDVMAARANGFIAIAVATGNFGPDELRLAGADLVLESLEGIGPAVELLKRR
ncbi:MAG TPA: haloacid dehalogenase-like hydrolase [Candidatus Limnocylindrales bacterium]|nr:haloacid dehalogenase-like hydrolase [Candidatus Limnocylindrales bacterium]